MIRTIKWISVSLSILLVLFMALMLVNEINDVPPPKQFNSGLQLKGKELDYYYIDFSTGKYLYGKQHYQFDTAGIPLFSKSGKTYYHPVLISQYALGAYDYYLQNQDSVAKTAFLCCADWLAENLHQHDHFFYWEYHFEIEFPGGIYDIPWFSAMTQGQGASVLLRAYGLTAEEKYLLTARSAIEPLFFDLAQGGLSIVKGDNYIFPQEYPTNPPSDILNGAIYALFGIYDYLRVTDDPEIRQKYQTIINTFRRNIDDYDTQNWSLYCRWPGYWATPHYNSDHITQLKILYRISGIQKFDDYSKKFATYHFNWGNRANYVFRNHWRQLREFNPDDLRKIPDFLKRAFTN